jgi:hypothetical protein
MNYRAARVSHLNMSQGGTIIQGSAVIFGLIVSNAGSSAVFVELFDDANEVVLGITVPANDSKTYEVEWVTNGLHTDTLPESNDVTITVMHTQIGA